MFELKKYINVLYIYIYINTIKCFILVQNVMLYLIKNQI